MKTLIDTNVLISAVISPDGTAFNAFIKAVTHPNQGIICDQNIDELRRIINKKFPLRQSSLETFLSFALDSLIVVPIPDKEHSSENLVRDTNDRPILRAAIYAGSDILLTGDKDFLESSIDHPKILTPAEYLLL